MKRQPVSPKSALGQRLDAVMKARGLSGQKWSLDSGLQKDFVSQVRRGRSKSPSSENIMRLAETAAVNPAFLLLRSNEMDYADRAFEVAPIRNGQIRMIGYIGAGAQIIPFGIVAAHEAESERIDAPPGLTSGIAAEVRGISMDPVYRPGDIVIAIPWDDNLEKLAGTDCFVQVKDGPLYLKRLKCGRGKRFTLLSYNEVDTPPILDQIVEWAAPVRWVKRK